MGKNEIILNEESPTHNTETRINIMTTQSKNQNLRFMMFFRHHFDIFRQKVSYPLLYAELNTRLQISFKCERHNV